MFKSRKSFHHRHKRTFVSRDTANRLIEAFLLIQPPKHAYHQTLTFPFRLTDAGKAKEYLERWFNGVSKQFRKHEFGAFFMQERRSDRAIRYHVFIFFFNENNLPFYRCDMEKDLRAYLFRRWKAVTGGDVVNAANKMIAEPLTLTTLEYFVKTLRVLEKDPKRGEVNVWGKRGKKVFQRYGRSVSREEVASAFNALFQKCRNCGLPSESESSARNAYIPETSPAELETAALFFDDDASLGSEKVVIRPKTRAKLLS